MTDQPQPLTAHEEAWYRSWVVGPECLDSNLQVAVRRLLATLDAARAANVEREGLDVVLDRAVFSGASDDVHAGCLRILRAALAAASTPAAKPEGGTE